MTTDNPQVPWTDEQWARVNQVIQEEASRARVAATFLPLVGPLPPDSDFVRAQIIPPNAPLTINDRGTIQLATLQVKVRVRSAQMADPEMASVLALFRRAAYVLARLEDAVVFRGLKDKVRAPGEFEPVGGVNNLPTIYEVQGGQKLGGLWAPVIYAPDPRSWQWIPVSAAGDALVRGVSDAIGSLEDHGQFGPFAAVLGQQLFVVAQAPNKESLVLPQDRIIPLLGGGSLLRSSTLDDWGGYSGVVVALGGGPVELVVATDLSVQFLQVTEQPLFVFRVRESIALRIKEDEAIIRLYVPIPIVTRVSPNRGPALGSTVPAPHPVAITGTNFLGATGVKFGNSDAIIITRDSDNLITVWLPPQTAGDANDVNVTVTTLGGTSAVGPHFTYVP
jgi:uncharacterized linocin/CFP29 family protein